MTDKPEPPEDLSLIQWGYAPGGYNPLCDNCENRFDGDKRSWCCKPCAEKAKEKYENEPEFSGPPEEIHMWFASSGNVRKWSFEPFKEAEVKYIRSDIADREETLSFLQLAKIREATGTIDVPLEHLAEVIGMKWEAIRNQVAVEAVMEGVPLEELKQEMSQEP